MKPQIGDRVLAPWSDAGDRQEGTITRIRGSICTVEWDEHPEVYAGESDLRLVGWEQETGLWIKPLEVAR
jgi:hypothetical protein